MYRASLSSPVTVPSSCAEVTLLVQLTPVQLSAPFDKCNQHARQTAALPVHHPVHACHKIDSGMPMLMH